MERWHNHYLDGHPHFCTASVHDWQPLLTEQTIPILYEEWNAAREMLRVKVLAYVVMPHHYHSVLWAERGEQVSHFLRRTQSLIARRICPYRSMWKERPRVLPIYSSSILETKVNYLHRNPLRAGLVEDPKDWQHSSFPQLELGAEDVPFKCDDWKGISL